MALVCQRRVSQLRKFSQGVAIGMRNHFAAEDHFRSQRGISQGVSQAISQLGNGVGGLRNGTRVPKGCFAAAKFSQRGGMGLRNNFAEDGRFRSESSISQRVSFGCKIIS